mmetsp:Transcript_41491/g.47858  ORF Transcript_41491/g.47858 Transcript_41491/m.47858 type:complete len:80 (+) Transcript_41491:184-423(+)
MRHQNNFSSYRVADNINRLIKKFDIDIRNSLPTSIKNAAKDPNNDRNKNPNVIQNHVTMFEEEKRMNEEKLKLADNISK